MSDAVTTQVGYGRNKGDGSDSQNLQPADEMHRYADQSDSFCNKAIGERGMVQYRYANPLEGEEAKRYSDVLSKEANVMFEKAPAQFNSCLNAIMKAREIRCGICEDDDMGGHCFFHSSFNAVFMTKGFYENNGSPYSEFWEVLLHEYSHAIDYNIGGIDAHGFGTYASDGVRLKSTGNKTILECAVEELGGLHGEFDELVNESDTAKQKLQEYKELKELINEESSALDNAERSVAKRIASQIGQKWESVSMELAMLGIDFAGSYEDAEFVSQFVDDEPFKKELLAYFKDDGYSDVRNNVIEKKRKRDELNKKIRDKLKEVNDARFASTVSLSREFSDLNDIMSAVGGKGVGNKILGDGHGKEYFSNDRSRATEIFADIGPILAKDGKAAKWLKEKAPKLVSGYFELLNLGTERFQNKKEGV